MSADRFIRVAPSADAGLARLDIHLPPVNVFSAADLDELARVVRDAGDYRVLLLSGLPRAFSAGVSLAEHVPEPDAIERMLAAMRGPLTALVETPAVTVASISGACLGGGAEIAAACDLVIAAEDARIGFPEIRLGCFPPAAVVLLPARMGETRAAEWILTGGTYSGAEAAAAGFATRAVPASSLESETRRLVEGLLSRGPAALAAARAALRFPRLEALNRLKDAEDLYRGLAGDPHLAQAIRDFGKR